MCGMAIYLNAEPTGKGEEKNEYALPKRGKMCKCIGERAYICVISLVAVYFTCSGQRRSEKKNELLRDTRVFEATRKNL